VLEDGGLLSQRNILKRKVLSACQSGSNGLNKNDEPLQYVWSLTRRFRKRQ